MCAGVVSGNGGVDDGVDEMMRTRNHVHDVRCEMLRRSSFPRALVFSRGATGLGPSPSPARPEPFYRAFWRLEARSF